MPHTIHTPASDTSRRLTPALAALAIAFASSQLHAQNFQSVGIYQTVAQLGTWAQQLASTNPDIVKLVEIGRSVQDRPIHALQITQHAGLVDGAKPEFALVAGLHAREVITSESMYRFADRLVSDYRANDPQAVEALRTREVWIVPNLNPDGRVRVEGGGSGQRKNMRLLPGQNANSTNRGVDLNRNFPYRWNEGTTSVTSDTYRGTSVLSEPEANALWSFFNNPTRFGDLIAGIDYHSGISLIIPPWSNTTDPALPPADAAIIDRIANGVAARTGFPIDYVGYDAYGTLVDSMYAELGAYSLTVELFGGTNQTNLFTFFNPITASSRDSIVSKAIASSYYMLSDEAFVTTEPGDFDADDLLSPIDISLLLDAPQGPVSESTRRFDINNDGVVDSRPDVASTDADAWITLLAGTRAGDADLDRIVNFNDLLALAQNYNTNADDWSRGDFNGTGMVDFADLLLLAQNYGFSGADDFASLGLDLAADWSLALSLVPEPASLVGVIAPLVLLRRRTSGNR